MPLASRERRPTPAARPLVLLPLVLLGCEELRPAIGQPVCADWKTAVAPLLQDGCGDCHGRPVPAAALDVSDYVQVMQAETAILTVFGRDADHPARPELERRLADWFERCDAAFTRSSIHDRDIMRPDRSGFHGALLAASGYDVEQCAECHGDDFAGGSSGAACIDCHEEGPLDCAVCHGDRMTSGLHAVHLEGGPLEAPVDCATCHEVPEDPLAPGHFRLERGVLDPPPAEVRLSGPAGWGTPTTEAPVATATASYDPATGTCAVYCHGGLGEDAAAARPRPSWSDARAMGCGDCHGQLFSDHPSGRCGDCHGATASGPGTIVATGPHLDGRLSFAAEDDCSACHGDDGGLPAPDLDGRVDRSLSSVGTHATHARPRLRLSAPVACEECHLVPEGVTDPGHIDSDRPAEVFPSGAGELARVGGATPRYDPVAATCSDVACHGPADVGWTAAAVGEVFCGSCHGIPPESRPHADTFGFSDCVRCHVRSVDPFGNILFVDGRTAHMNGVVDFDTGDGR